MDERARHDEGMRVRREVLGGEHVDRAVAATDEFTAGFQDLITRYAWGEVWGSDALERPTRSCVTLALLAAGGLDDEFVLHLRGARNNGVGWPQIAQVLLHVAVYAGVPRANHAFALARAVFADEGGPDADPGGGA